MATTKSSARIAYGLVWSINYKDEEWDIIGGLSLQNFDGNHFGYVTYAANDIVRQKYLSDGDYRYYDSDAHKLDGNVYVKAAYHISEQWDVFADIQYRHVGYKTDGINDKFYDDGSVYYNQRLDIDEKYPDTEVVIRANKLDSDVERLVAMMRMVNMQIGVRKNDETYLLDVEKILYIEAVERKTFVYTSDETYESDLKLYEIEQELLERDFFRISKQSIVNIRMIKSLKSDINRKIRITLRNDEQIVVSRMYSDELRRKLGLK